MAAEKNQNQEAIQAFAAKSEQNLRTVALAKKLRKEKIPSPLAVSYWSTVPYKYGDRAVKYSVKPAERNQIATPQFSSENYLREAMVEHLAKHRRCVTSKRLAKQILSDPIFLFFSERG